MGEMLERVALAISGGDDPASILGIHRTRARAAITAIREPTEKMREAGLHPAAQPNEWALDLVERGYQRMIDEALK